MEITLTSFAPIKQRFIELSDENTFNKEASFALQQLAKSKYLASMDKNSIIQSVLNISQVGLTLNPVLKLAHLVPRDGKCCLDVSYQGMVKLITDTGSVKNVYAHTIHSNDIFEQSMGTDVEIIHKPKLNDRGDITGVYAVAILNDGKKQIEVMNVSEINSIRDISESYKSFKSGKSKNCIWESFYDEMARKTVIKRLCKYLPKTDKWEKIGKAIDLDNDDYKISNSQSVIIEQLLNTCSFSEEKRQYLLENIPYLNHKEASELISDLKDNQVDPINSGSNYSQTDISKAISKLK